MGLFSKILEKLGINKPAKAETTAPKTPLLHRFPLSHNLPRQRRRLLLPLL